jgi:hypothetical protein
MHCCGPSSNATPWPGAPQQGQLCGRARAPRAQRRGRLLRARSRGCCDSCGLGLAGQSWALGGARAVGLVMCGAVGAHAGCSDHAHAGAARERRDEVGEHGVVHLDALVHKEDLQRVLARPLHASCHGGSRCDAARRVVEDEGRRREERRGPGERLAQRGSMPVPARLYNRHRPAVW